MNSRLSDEEGCVMEIHHSTIISLVKIQRITNREDVITFVNAKAKKLLKRRTGSASNNLFS